ncbi:MAG: TonB-dependent receptor [Tannerella sp.]|jgi:iron complex outermembrane receptor protein|nr:TonB-dependent receptor [Tannerella sp.]
MHIRFIPAILTLAFACPLHAQETDSVRTVTLNEVVVSSSYRQRIERASAQKVHPLDERFLREHFAGNLVQTLASVPGVHSMDIGANFSKPMIRGMGFNRISVIENGIKQEGQQWGADHALEMDFFNVERVTVRKGPSSLLYGSDAMGGAIELARRPAPSVNQVYGEAILFGKSVNGTLGASAMLGVKKNALHTQLRFSEQHFGDYRIPADTVVYLTQRLPVHGRKLKNTAGFERDVALFAEYRKGGYGATYTVGNVYQKAGFFPGAHGIPDASRLEDDGNSRRVDLPYSTASHLKFTSRQQYFRERAVFCWDAGLQYNHREEWSRFHTHYGNQPVPLKDPDRELAFSLVTVQSLLKADLFASERWKHTAGWDVQHQRNRIAGYSFLLPAYERFTTGVLWLSAFHPNDRLSLSGGIRYDFGEMDIAAFRDVYLETYLRERAYAGEVIEAYIWRSARVNRHFGDVSGSLGISWEPGDGHLLKAHLGRSFRLPGAHELASNGVHHGAFRHEQGDASLASERGWQLDVSYACEREHVSLSASPFVSRFDHYIYLKPTGEWSILPHAGQIYRYTGAEALFAGAEVELGVDLLRNLTYRFVGEYVYTHNLNEHTPLSFSPPASMRNRLEWRAKAWQFHMELHSIATQRRVARNEDITPGATLLHLGAAAGIPVKGTDVEVVFSLRNLFNISYYNHLSFYRKVEIPEPGRNFQLLIKIPFKSKLK